MRVALVTSWPFPYAGGVSTHISLLAKGLGIDPDRVISFKQIASRNQAFGRRVATALEKQWRKLAGLDTITMHARSLRTILRDCDADIVHCHDAMATYAAVTARRKRNKFRIVSTVHGPVSRHMLEEGYDQKSPDLRSVEKCERLAWQQCDAIVAVDKTQADIVMGQGAEQGKIRIIRNAVDRPALIAKAKGLSVSRPEQERWLFVPRRLAPKNGVDIAVKALSLVPGRDTKLIVAGDGPERIGLESLARGLGVAERVVFLGALEHAAMLPLMAACDMVLIPSVPRFGIVEATSLAAIEAMALGKCVRVRSHFCHLE